MPRSSKYFLALRHVPQRGYQYITRGADMGDPPVVKIVRSPAPFRTGLPSPSVYPYRDRKSTRLNSSHVKNSYAVFCLKKKNILLDQTDGSFSSVRIV